MLSGISFHLYIVSVFIQKLFDRLGVTRVAEVLVEQAFFVLLKIDLARVA
jgi:hypothetical protein